MSQYTRYSAVSGGGSGTVTAVSASSPLASSGGTTPNLTIQTASDSQPGALSAADHVAFSAKQPAGSYITSLTGGVTASGPGAAAATVVTNANLTGDVTSVGNATTLTNAPVIAKVLTGYTSGAGTVSATDSILTAIQKLNGNAPGVSSSAKVIYVSQDTGNDSNVGTMYSPFKTIQAGINAANLIAAYQKQVIVKVSPSDQSYTENLTFSQQGVVLESCSPRYRADSVYIKGNIVINLTGTAGGVDFVASQNYVYIKGFILQAPSGDTITFSGSTFQRLWISDCYIDCVSGSALVCTNTGVNIVASTVNARDCDFNNGSATVPTVRVSAGRFWAFSDTFYLQNTNASGPSLLMDGAAATGASVILTGCQLTGQVQITDNLASFTTNLCSITSGAASAISTPSSPNTGLITLSFTALSTTAANSITGSGVVVLLGAYKLSTGGDIISTVTQASVGTFPQGPTMIGVGSTQNTNTLLTVKNGHITSQQTTAPTSALQAGAGNTATRTLTRCTDTAGNISIAVAGTGIAAGAQLIVTFNKAYATAPVVTLTPTNANAALVIGAYVTSSTTTFTINFAAAGTTGTTYTFTYQVIET